MILSSIEQLLLLQRLPETGSASYWRLLDQFPSLRVALDAPLDALTRILAPAACDALMEFREQGESADLYQRVKADLDWIQENGIQILDTDSEYYPKLLREVRRAPPVLYVWGDPKVLSLPQIAIVGSRNPTPSGRDNACSFAADLAAKGVTITSGLALGVDAAAHQGALSVNGKTIAVLGTGIDHIYPQRNRQIAEQIVRAGGAVISEFPLGTEPQPSNFPQRNRIISGLSFGVLVVEAAVKSGSLITARYALQQDREVFAIPGSIHNPLSRGCHLLIKDGAKLVESAKDIIEEIQGFLALKWQEFDLESSLQAVVSGDELVTSENEEVILSNMDFDPVSVDKLAARTGLGIGELMASLLTMEVKGLVGNMGSGYARARSKSRAKELMQ